MNKGQDIDIDKEDQEDLEDDSGKEETMIIESNGNTLIIKEWIEFLLLKAIKYPHPETISRTSNDSNTEVIGILGS